RAAELVAKLLVRVRQTRARVVVIDVTGVPSIDSHAAGRLEHCARAVRLMGARCLLCGLSSDACKALVDLGVELVDVETHSSLDAALLAARGAADAAVTLGHGAAR